MDEWIKSNALSIITLLMLIASIIAGRARKDAKLDQMGKDLGEMDARIEKIEQDVETVGTNLAAHRENTARHRDPDRDERTHKEFMARFDKIEAMLMRMINKNQ